jgi:hypothetical protein
MVRARVEDKDRIFTDTMERIPTLDLNELVSNLALVDPIRSMVRTHIRMLRELARL